MYWGGGQHNRRVCDCDVRSQVVVNLRLSEYTSEDDLDHMWNRVVFKMLHINDINDEGN